MPLPKSCIRNPSKIGLSKGGEGIYPAPLFLNTNGCSSKIVRTIKVIPQIRSVKGGAGFTPPQFSLKRNIFKIVFGRSNYNFIGKRQFVKTGAGFTLIEILAVIGILAVLGTFGYLVTIDFYKSYAFNAERNAIVAILQKARSQSLANINQFPHGVHFDSDQYVIFQGSVYDSGNSFNQKIPAAFGITHSGIIDVVFAQLSGDASPGGNLILSDGKRLTTISINNEGRINW